MRRVLLFYFYNLFQSLLHREVLSIDAGQRLARVERALIGARRLVVYGHGALHRSAVSVRVGYGHRVRERPGHCGRAADGASGSAKC